MHADNRRMNNDDANSETKTKEDDESLDSYQKEVERTKQEFEHLLVE